MNDNLRGYKIYETLYRGIKSSIFEVRKQNKLFILKLQTKKFFDQEMSQYEKLTSFPYKIQILESWSNEKFGYIVMEHGYRELKLNEFTMYSNQITSMIEKLHELGFEHHDLHLKNILFQEQKKKFVMIDFEYMGPMKEYRDFDTLIISSSGRYRPPLYHIHTEQGLYYYRLFERKIPASFDDSKYYHICMLLRSTYELEEFKMKIENYKHHPQFPKILLQCLRYLEEEHISIVLEYITQDIMNQMIHHIVESHFTQYFDLLLILKRRKEFENAWIRYQKYLEFQFSKYDLIQDVYLDLIH